jgi:hypothetical protein
VVMMPIRLLFAGLAPAQGWVSKVGQGRLKSSFLSASLTDSKRTIGISPF